MAETLPIIIILALCVVGAILIVIAYISIMIAPYQYHILHSWRQEFRYNKETNLKETWLECSRCGEIKDYKQTPIVKSKIGINNAHQTSSTC